MEDGRWRWKMEVEDEDGRGKMARKAGTDIKEGGQII
jgi:hypothetical protein